MNVEKHPYIYFLIPALITTWLFYSYGDRAWAVWNIPTYSPSFLDTRILTASAESYGLGFNPEVENPQDPYGRLFNLPSVWKLLFLAKINQNHTYILAGIFIASFILGLLAFAYRMKGVSALLLALCTFSPPIFLAFERGNVDLFIFMLCAFSLMLERSSKLHSIFFLWIAGCLKIYPIFGFISSFDLDRKKFETYITFFLLAFGFYALFTLDSFIHVFSNTEVGFDISYGLGTIPYYVEVVTGSYRKTLIASLISFAMVIIIVFVIFRLWLFSRHSLIGNNSYYLSSFRLGAGIYIGTFMLGNNWDYRLIFLLFALPQLLNWMKRNKMAKYTLLAVLITFMYLWLVLIFPFAYFLDEFANWFVFAGLFYLVIVSLPEWINEQIHLFLAKTYWRNS